MAGIHFSEGEKFHYQLFFQCGIECVINVEIMLID
jgi:hypothetical protein